MNIKTDKLMQAQAAVDAAGTDMAAKEERVRAIADEIGYMGFPPRSLTDANRIVRQQVERSNELQRRTNAMQRKFEKQGMSPESAHSQVEKTAEWQEFVAPKPAVERFAAVFIESTPGAANPQTRPGTRTRPHINRAAQEARSRLT